MIADSEKKKDDYIFDAMVKAGWDDREFLTEEEVMERWRLTDGKQMHKFIYGKNRRHLKLPVIRFGHKTRRYRPSDVLAFEWECMRTEQ